MSNTDRTEQDEFRRNLKEEWTLLWRERFDDRFRAEGVAVRDYPLLLMNRGHVVFASRDAKSPSFPEIIDYWSSKSLIYSPDPDTGGWGKFIRTTLKELAHSRARAYDNSKRKPDKGKQQLRKCGRGWLHIQ